MSSVAAPAAAGEFQPRSQADWLKLFLGFGGMVIGQFMAILDIQIVASSLPQIQAGIGASTDEIAWVQTIYLLAEVVIMPLTAYMTRLWGTRNTYVVCCLAFIVTSVMTGLSGSIEVMIAFRALQGLAAGAVPARGVAPLPGRRVRLAGDADRQRQNPGRAGRAVVAGAETR